MPRSLARPSIFREIPIVRPPFPSDLLDSFNSEYAVISRIKWIFSRTLCALSSERERGGERRILNILSNRILDVPSTTFSESDKIPNKLPCTISSQNYSSCIVSPINALRFTSRGACSCFLNHVRGPLAHVVDCTNLYGFYVRPNMRDDTCVGPKSLDESATRTRLIFSSEPEIIPAEESSRALDKPAIIF